MTTAVCFAGQLRTFETVRENIRVSLRSLEPEVFAFLKTARSHEEVRRLFEGSFRLVALRLRGFYDPYTGVNSHCGCWPMIRRREAQLGRLYSHVLRLRTDVAYADPRYLAAIARTHGPPGAHALYVEACGESRRMGGEVNGTCRRMHGDRYGCLKDTWAWMGRRAADTYFGLRPGDLGCTASGPPCLRPTAECKLGAAVLRDPRIVATVVALKRRIVRPMAKRG